MILLKKIKSIFIPTFLCLVFSQICFGQFTIPNKPKFQTSVFDYANVLSSNEKSRLEEKLIRYSDSTSTQIVIITIESLQGEDVSILATKWGQTWGFGKAKEDNGVIVLLAKQERKIAINPGYGLEYRLTAGLGGQIIRNIIVPEFKAGSFFNGFDKGTDAIIDIFKGKYKAMRHDDAHEIPLSTVFFIVFVLLFLIVMISKKGGGNSGGSGSFGSTLLNAIILSNLGRSSGGGFGGGSSGGGYSDGGGFGGGFGGGGFSGGGSSGSW